MERAEFEKLVAEGFARLPKWVREKIENVALLVEDRSEDETLLGLYQGIPLTGRSVADSMTLPDTITLYQAPIEKAAQEDGMDVRDVIAETIWHEFAHHFGMDETQVRLREQKRKL